MTLDDLMTILPLVILVGWGLLLLLVDLWVPRQRKGITAVLAAVGLALTLGFSLVNRGQTQLAFNGMAVVDGFATFLDVIFLVSGLVGVALAYNYLKRMGIERGEYYSLLIFTISGMMLMTYAYDLIVVFLALELLSLPLYILAGFVRLQVESEEAALKYFLMGAFSTGFVLYGTALVFGATAHTDLVGIVAAVRDNSADLPLLLVGAALLLVGFGFKSAVVPFHMWTPDVYQGAPSPATAFMSVGAKVAGFAALMRVFVVAFPVLAPDLTPVLWVLAALTMIVGNLAAIAQSNVKRLLAYSSIAHSGYLLMAFVPYGQGQALGAANTIPSILFYLVAYSLSTLGAWAVIIALEKAEGGGLDLADYAGLGRKYPGLGLAMTVFMFSFIGVPVTLGFWGKYYLFRTVLEGGFTGLALIGLLASLVSAYYYLRVVVLMYMHPGEPEVVKDPWVRLTAIAAAVAVVVLGLVPGLLIHLAANALLYLQ